MILSTIGDDTGSIRELEVVTEAPDFILYAQHGWADDHKAIATLAKTLATPKTRVITPNLGWFKTWLRMEPLVEQVESIAIKTIASYPNIPIRIIAHSMGGLIWLEILNRHPEWWSKVDSLVLIASPVGGAHIARLLDPLGIGVGIARDLGRNRRQMAHSIAQFIPTLVITGDTDGGSDGTINIETTKFNYTQLVVLPNLAHATLKNHPKVVETIRDFCANPVITPPKADLTVTLIQRLRSVTGMTDAHQRDFCQAKTYLTFSNGVTLRRWNNPLQIEHVFVSNTQGECLYGGFVGWMHAKALHQVLDEIKQQYYF